MHSTAKARPPMAVAALLAVLGVLFVPFSTASAQALKEAETSAPATDDAPIRTAPRTPTLEAWVNNLGDPKVGSEKIGLGLYHHAPSSPVESFSASFEQSLNGRSQAVTADLTVAASNRLKLLSAAARSELHFPSGQSRIHARSDVVAGGILLPLDASRRHSGEVMVQVVSKESEASVGDLILLDEQVSAVRLIYHARSRKPSRMDRLRIGVLQSLPDATNFNVDRRTRSGLATYSKNFGTVSARYEGAYRLSATSEVFISVGGQYAWAPIPYSFKFAYGGAGYGGAFDPDALVGDNGASGALELRRSVRDVGPVTVGRAYVRLDAGWVRSRTFAFAPAEDRAASVGVGLKANIAKHLSFQVEYNRPVAKPRFARQTADRILFEIVARTPV